MQNLLSHLERYLHETLGVSVVPVRWKGSDHIPFFLQDRYDFFEARLLSLSCLFMAGKGDDEESPVTIRKHIAQVQGKWNGRVVYIRARVTAYNRKRLIEHKVPFVVPGNQMYLPMLGVDLREHFKKLRVGTPKLSPSAQAVLIYALLRGSSQGLKPAELASTLGYSAMTMSRAFDELDAAELGKSSLLGRERFLRIEEPKREIWAKAQSFLRTPVKNRCYIRLKHRKLPGPRAGLNALAHYSMLAEPDSTTVALSQEAWKLLQRRGAVVKVATHDPDVLNVEIWSYAPKLFAGSGVVDPLSLYLSLRGTNDERIEAAIEQMIEDVEW